MSEEPTTPELPEPALQDARDALMAGRCVAFPTDTVWGLGAHPFDENAVARIYVLKGRPAEKALQVLCLPHAAERLLDLTGDVRVRWEKLVTLWPGGLTLVAPASRACPEWLVRDGKVGLREPASPVARALVEACGGLLAATSLNRSGEPSVRTHGEALALGIADLVVPGEDTSALASTVYGV
ncbi:L-threonylcarbamoyladenylate synthase, partial [Deinococcus pimensis]|uniref:L-threonylcarbamoyladenylate synthase n=1 Tax=Deinococcus pimensis TaxID=309888 RepID=UPI0005EB4038